MIDWCICVEGYVDWGIGN